MDPNYFPGSTTQRDEKAEATVYWRGNELTQTWCKATQTWWRRILTVHDHDLGEVWRTNFDGLEWVIYHENGSYQLAPVVPHEKAVHLTGNNDGRVRLRTDTEMGDAFHVATVWLIRRAHADYADRSVSL